VSTPRERLRAVNGEARAIAGLFVAFGVVAGVLALVGLYGVAAFSVNARTREFGIRMALGADAPRITRFVLREGARQFVPGWLLGLALALGLARVGEARLENFLYQVNPRDPAIYGIVLLLFAAVAGLACWLPARRATKVDPVVALRAE
jgi:putative ABC transport system permease protein